MPFVSIATIQPYLITTFMTQLYKHAPEIVSQGFLCQEMYVHHVLETV